jgi:hypothetical protein
LKHLFPWINGPNTTIPSDKREGFICKQAQLFQTCSIAGFLVAKLLLENPKKSRILWNNEEEEILNPLSFMTGANNPKRKHGWKTYIV